MRRLIIAFIVILATGITSQNALAAKPMVEDIFKELSAEPGATKVSINPFVMWMCKMFAGDSPEEKITKKTKSLNVLNIDGCKEATQQKVIKRIDDLKSDGYEEMIRVNDKEDKVRIYAKIEKETIRRIVIVALSGKDCALVDIQGKFDLSEIDELVKSHTSGNDDGR
ncbi:MAG: DUF4252 domain-containing protein [Muribaculaceae bacterium]|nr:DUF4252 domain-containing protein [Muribaculaceae bacterium]